MSDRYRVGNICSGDTYAVYGCYIYDEYGDTPNTIREYPISKEDEAYALAKKLNLEWIKECDLRGDKIRLFDDLQSVAAQAQKRSQAQKDEGLGCHKYELRVYPTGRVRGSSITGGCAEPVGRWRQWSNGVYFIRFFRRTPVPSNLIDTLNEYANEEFYYDGSTLVKQKHKQEMNTENNTRHEDGYTHVKIALEDLENDAPVLNQLPEMSDKQMIGVLLERVDMIMQHLGIFCEHAPESPEGK